MEHFCTVTHKQSLQLAPTLPTHFSQRYLRDPPALWVLPSAIPLFGNYNSRAFQNRIYTLSRDTWTTIANGQKNKTRHKIKVMMMF